MSFSACNASHVFIDLATFSEIEGFLYGGPDAVTWYVAAVQKANWQSFIPITLRTIGINDFGQKNVAASVNRSGDYVIHTWFRARIPQVYLYDSGLANNQPAVIYTDASVRWTRNLMHNIFISMAISLYRLI